MKIPFRKLRRQRRRYPIQYDEDGRSNRQVCFEEFDRGKRPVQVSREYKFNLNSVYTYHRDWKKLRPGFRKDYELVKVFKKKAPDFHTIAIKVAASSLDLSEMEFLHRLQQPWGLKRLMDGSWENSRRDPARAEASTKLAKLMAHLIIFNGLDYPPENIIEKLEGVGVVFLDAPPPEDPVSQDILDQLDNIIDEEEQADRDA